MSRFAATFQRLQAERACGLFPYLMAGFPDVATSQALAEAALAAGADGFEIAIPFSDPLADGATLQRVNTAALEGGATPDTALDLARFIRQRSPDTPVALMTYYNPVLHRGEQAFARALREVGADGAIIPDLPIEEAVSLHHAFRQQELDFIPLLAPTSTDERIKRTAAQASGFIYCVSLVGVTGSRTDLSDSLGSFLARVKQHSSIPLVVGFGISRPEHVRNVAAHGARGAIVASALFDLIERSPDPVAAARAYLAEMKVAGHLTRTEA